jgi:putative heme-binding domain-containing protein
VQYRQYPFPAGLKVVRYDQYLRAVFDRVPEPPPRGTKGADVVTVLEDADGDGRYESAKDVITGLNIATSCVVGAGGIWVLNPPYLLFYPDADGDDVPDRDPEVRLSGFGIEDTHATANNLVWGPDGWLYGVTGSTTTGLVSSDVTKDVAFQGQLVWRYHPATRVFEIFAEGGGNTYSLEIDAKGRVFSGSNYGGTRGMFYPQGSYAEKNWGKHGPLTNPYAFGHFMHMRHEGDDVRFPQTFAIEEGGRFPAPYRGAVIAGNALHNRIWASTLLPDGSTYRTVDLPPLVVSRDHWFRPVHVAMGPDGGLAIADWYDCRLTHVDPRDNWHKASGRIYRLRAADAPPLAPFDLERQSADELVELLGHANRWFRQTAVRVLAERGDRGIVPRLRALVEGNDPGALEALWTVYRLGGLDDALAIECLRHPDPHVRRWTVRLVGDDRRASPDLAAALVELAAREGDVQVRAQLASTAKRLPGGACLPIVRALAARDEDAADPHLPLLIWWALESQADSDRTAVEALFADRAFWDLPIVDGFLVERTMRRYAMTDRREDLDTCTRLFALAPDDRRRERLVAGLLEAFRGRRIEGLPPELAAAIDAHRAAAGSDDLALGLRLGDPKAIATALATLADEGADLSRRLACIEILGQTKQPRAVEPLLRLVSQDGSPAVRRAALETLSGFPDPEIGPAVVKAYHQALAADPDLRAAAWKLLASRPAWAVLLLGEVAGGRIDRGALPHDLVQALSLLPDPEVQAAVERLYGRVRPTATETEERIAAIVRLVRQGGGDAAAGRVLFAAKCGTCHALFGTGGGIGPDLTGYERTNLDFLVPAIVDPSSAIREEYTNFVVVTADGRTLTGLVADQDTRTLTLRGADGRTTLLDRDDIEELRALPVSLMPERLLDDLGEQGLRDLFAHLTSRAPAPVPMPRPDSAAP